ncbi:MAG: tetratricopeptide repeat protein [Elusimicrobia bacterium]|nr:tetratricopeptide repeat protein [Elusimicrobiota bacterium]
MAPASDPNSKPGAWAESKPGVWTRLLPWLVAAAAFLAFVPALESLFVNWDDRANFLDNPEFQKLGLGELRWMFSTFHLAHYQPVTWLTWGLDKAVWGTNPFGYHLTNLLLHCAAAFLFCVLARRTLDKTLPESVEFHPFAAALAALLFAVHPLRVEAVAWATERRELLSSLLYLGAVAVYLRIHWAEEGESRPGIRWVWVLAALAMLSNVRTVSLPLALILLDYHPLGRFSGGRGLRDPAVWREKIPFFLMALAAGVVGLMAQAATSTLIPVGKAGLSSRLAQSCFGVGFYLWKTLAPSGLASWYGDSYSDQRAWVAALGGLAAVALTAGLAASTAGRRPLAGRAMLAAWSWYLITLFPTLGIVKSGRQIVADRYSYLPCLALALLAAAGLSRLWTLARAGRIRRPVFAAAAASGVACLTCLGGATWRQCRVWNDSVSLWSRAQRIDPSSVFVRTNLGIALLQSGQFAPAVEAFEAIKEDAVGGMDPDSGRAFFSFVGSLTAIAHNNLGLALFSAGKAAEAVAEFEKAVSRAPDFLDARLNLASALAKAGRTEAAAAHFEAVNRAAPGDPRAVRGLKGLRGRGRGRSP